MSWEHTFELPVRLLSQPGKPYRAICRFYRGFSKTCAVTAMQRAAARALNGSRRLNVPVKPEEIVILGDRGERTARYVVGKACPGCADLACPDCMAKARARVFGRKAVAA